MPDLIADRAGGGEDKERRELPPIKGFIETSFLDWKGLVSSVLFLPRCNFRCPYCHNFELASTPEAYQDLPFEHIKERLAQFKGWIDGVVVSGGEPTLHPELPALLAALKAEGFKVKLDTNGHKTQVLRDILGDNLVDLVAMDLKAPLEPLAYRRAAGRTVDLERIAASIELLKGCGVDHEFRSTIWPAWHGEAELSAMAQTLKGCQAWSLQALNPDSAWNRQALGKGRAYSAEEVDRLQKDLANPVCI
jgi:pyruvate formate lyase activating enzyme